MHIDGYIIIYALVLSMARPRTVHFMGDLDGFGIALASRLSSRNIVYSLKCYLSMLEDKIETMGVTVQTIHISLGRTIHPNDLILFVSGLEQQFRYKYSRRIP